MQIISIELRNFRNYDQARFVFEPQGCLIIGNNGSGKTNLLEAMAYCGLGKSIRFHNDDDLLQFGTKKFNISAIFHQETTAELRLDFEYDSGVKLLVQDGKPIRQLSSVLENVKIIYCAPEDINIISGSPRSRRQYFDLCISQVYPKYLTILKEYIQTLKQRNFLLKKEYKAAQKKAWDDCFVRTYLEVLNYRKMYLKELNNHLGRRYSDLSDSVSTISAYYSFAQKQFTGGNVSLEDVRNWMHQNEDKEKHYERSLLGAHLDDYVFLLNDTELKLYGSGGQKRIVAVILKLIQSFMVTCNTSIKPIILFDDIFAELDIKHITKIRELIESDYQVFITSPRPNLQEHWPQHPHIRLPSWTNETK